MALSGHACFTKLDLLSGFHQLYMSEESISATAFATPEGLFEFVRVPMGLKISPQFFHAALQRILQPLLYQTCVLYIDDIVVFASSSTELEQRTRQVFEILSAHNLKLKWSKCVFDAAEIEFLGFVVNGQGVRISEQRKQAIREIKPPTTVATLRSFLGLTNFFRKFIPGYSLMAQPLYSLTSPKSANFTWLPDHQQAFDALVAAVADAPVLRQVDPDTPLDLYTDASTKGVGAFLVQNDQPITFLSRSFDSRERHWSTIEQECFAIFWAITHLEHYLLGRRFRVYCDHRNLSFIRNSNTPKVIRWSLALQEFDFEVIHIAGKDNVVADALSRCLVLKATDQETTPPAKDVNTGGKIAFASAFSQVHNSRVGHHGVDTTWQKLQSAFPQDVGSFTKEEVVEAVASCSICQKLSQAYAPSPSPHFSMKTFDPFVCLSIDHITSLPVDANGNTAILVVVDHFTRYSFVFPVRSVDASEVAQSLLQVYGFVGTPRFLSSDNGSAFISDVIKGLNRLLGVNQSFTTEYNHQQNGLVERRNKEVLRLLRAIVMDRLVLANWSAYLPIVQNILNNTTHGDTGFSPNDLVFGINSNNSRRALFFNPSAEQKDIDIARYFKDMVTAQQRMIERAANKEEIVESEVPQQFADDSWVLVDRRKNNQFTTDLSKLAPTYLGPYQVRSYNKKTGVYMLEDFTNSSTGKNVLPYHVSQLKEFVNSSSVNPVTIAAKDRNELIIDSILQHSGNPARKTGMKFLVKFSDQSEQWLGYNSLKNTMALDAYSKSNQLSI
jgi:transposase InsO family protein